MERAFSFPSNGIGYFIGHQILNSEEIAILSPWISDIKVKYPYNNRGYDSESLSAAIRNRGGVKLIVGEKEHNDYFLSRVPDDSYRIMEDLHAKAIVCTNLALIGSANVTMGGLHHNIEISKIVENNHDSIDDFIDKELN
ncbi:MAG: hypothetical protein ABEJ95_03325 [Candidatus Nanohalobium sp.]